ncbi:protein-glutamine glutaminase family protein [Bdellovibrio svalbardensis]|uniref:Protein-glutamine glutaminase family protein n=1 Tax=Bdellovibrio svalbardensis TaxID=2972972 RepID=A0ABT6DET0_9BACT|nr:protein-glutamine glutaminase family protein [Bdellovibrio svalbardensis]MDG0814997.1 protein-glutamine glutaminase family protein [Bdellovibrio svalbardensis]
MKSIVGVLFSFAVLIPFLAEARGLSAHRHAGESYQQAAARNYPRHIELVGSRPSTPDRIKKPLQKLDLKEIPDVGSLPDLENQFKYVRDTRFMADSHFPRRLTWMYPDDGCYARAEMVSQKIIAQHFTEPKKIFVFGNLSAKTTNAPGGSVQWWYHVAVIYRVGQVAYVVDPALNPQKPMTLTEWNKAVGGEQTKVQYAICSHDTFDPDSDCYGPLPMSAAQAEAEQSGFLQDEWDRLLELNRSPEKELGDFPPWL